MATPPASSAPASFVGGVTLEAIMGGFTTSPSPSPQVSEDEGNDNGSSDDDEGVKQNILGKKTIYIFIYF